MEKRSACGRAIPDDEEANIAAGDRVLCAMCHRSSKAPSPLVAANFAAGIVIVIYGALIAVFCIAVGQLLFAIRDMAINSFHIRRSLVTLSRSA